MVTSKKAWGEDRVYFHDDRGRLRHLPTVWTSAAPADPFQVVAAGRCHFRLEDLLRLADLVERLMGWPSVMGNTPLV